MAKKESAWICAMKVILTILLAAVLAFGGAVGGWFAHKDNWFGLTEKTEKPEDPKKDPDDPAHEDEKNGGLKMSEPTENGIALMAAAVPIAQLGDADSAQTITATVKPNNEGDNSGVAWSAAWKNPASEWATGKDLKEYLTLTPQGESVQESKVVTARCLQAFGEQIIITVTSSDNPEVTAEVTADYARKVTDVSLSFGDVVCDFDSGKTNVIVEVNPEGTPKGGTPQFSLSYGETYTVENPAETSLKLEEAKNSYGAFLQRIDYNSRGTESYFIFYGGTSENKDYTKLNTFNLKQNGLYFGIKWFVQNLGMRKYYGGYNSTIIDLDDYSPLDVTNQYNACIDLHSEDEQFGLDYWRTMFDLTVTIESSYQHITKKTSFIMSGYTNQSTVSGVETDKPSITF